MVLITCETKSKVSYTVDGTNPAPDRQFVSLFTRLYTSQDFFHQQYHNKNKEGYEHDIDSLINFDSGEFHEVEMIRVVSNSSILASALGVKQFASNR